MSKRKELYKEKLELPVLDSLVHLDCPECHTPIKSENINLDKGIAKCHHCDALFDYEMSLPPIRRKPEVYLPKGVEVLRLRNELEIKYKWRKNMSNFMLFFTLFWNGLLLPFVISVILSGQWHMLIFLSLHLAVGLGFLYHSIANLINMTYVTANNTQLSIEHGPIRMPFNSNIDIPVDQIHQIYVEKYSNGSTNGVPNIVYRVKAILTNSQQIVLAKGFKNTAPAHYLEQELEYFLGIDDERVTNEVIP